MPKGRYKIMRAYMPKVGTRGLDMMFRTCTVQVNLDFCSEADMVTQDACRARRCSRWQRPCSPTRRFMRANRTGCSPTGREVWRDTDNARAGIPAAVFEEGFGFEAYAELAARCADVFCLSRRQIS